MDNSPTKGGEPKDTMAEEKQTTPPVAPKEDKSKKEPAPEQQEDWGKITDGKFKSEAELAKAYKEAEKKLSEQGEQIGQYQDFTATIQPILNVIRDDPEVFKILDERLRKGEKPGEPPKPEAKGEEKPGTDQDEIRAITSDLLLAKFEEKHGINKLSPDKGKELRNIIGNVIYELTGKTLKTVDLRRLEPILENSYVIARERVDKSTLEALKSAQEVEGGIPSVPSSPGTTGTTLTSEEATVAEKLGQTREQYLAGKESLAKMKKA